MLVAADLSKLHYPVLRFLRPAFFAARRRHLKACFVSMFKSMFACLPLMLILSFSVIIFAVIGWIGFDSSKAPYNTLNHEEGHCSTANHGDGTNSSMPIGSCNDYFLTFSSSIYQVWILLVKVSSGRNHFELLDAIRFSRKGHSLTLIAIPATTHPPPPPNFSCNR